MKKLDEVIALGGVAVVVRENGGYVRMFCLCGNFYVATVAFVPILRNQPFSSVGQRF